VLLDLHLPDMSGPDLVMAFRARAPGVPLILHSAADDTAAVSAVRGLVDAVTLKSDVAGVLGALARLTGACTSGTATFAPARPLRSGGARARSRACLARR